MKSFKYIFIIYWELDFNNILLRTGLNKYFFESELEATFNNRYLFCLVNIWTSPNLKW